MDVALTPFDQLLRAAALLERDMVRSLEASGLSSARMHVLWAIGQLGPQSQQQLATILEVTPRNITGLIDGLAESGHVSREAHPTDRRVVLVTLTASGQVLVDAAVRDHAAISAELTAAVPAADRAALTRGLAAVVDRLEALVLAEERGR